MANAVVVTGLGVISPLNPEGDRENFWAALCTGETGVAGIRSFDASSYPCGVAAEVRRDRLRGGEAEAEPALIMAGAAFQLALDQAGIRTGGIDPRRAGVIVGTVLGGTVSGERYLRAKRAEDGEAAKGLEQYPLRAIASHLACRSGFSGPVLTVSTACASGTDAIGIAFRKIASGSADVIVAGGVDVICELAFSGFSSLKALTSDKVRPFSLNRTGLALGEGAAFLVLERETAAVNRGAEILGSIAGYASRSDAFHLTAPHREGCGLAAAAKAALRDGGSCPGEIDYVNAHGTGTPYNDLMETKAIKIALGNRARAVPISSVKAALGHSFGAAGALEAAVCLLAIRDGIVPPTLNYEEPDPDCDLDFVPNLARKVSVRTALSLSAGFGGQNAALLIRGRAS
ncbi:MAG TPA: beta-ketoacyl-[acyl-carrier-protein] synthase family protein [Candidatus Methylomirabilis sp.]|nr:beta-ketoacyl-[acyl-carrier-protein] synthase family protein [Candidatus Methylomirabilis sp.]